MSMQILALEDIQSILQQPYERSQWGKLLNEIFPNVSLYQVPQRIDGPTPDFVKDYAQIGTVRLADGKYLAVFEVRVGDNINLIRNRVGLRDLISHQINLGTAHGVLCVFNSNSPQFRFTFVCRETGFDGEGRIVTKETNPRRYSYVLGPGETRRTAAQRFEELARRREHTGLTEIMNAFSVERLNEEFFAIYKGYYQRFVDYLLDETDVPAKVFGIEARKGTDLYEAASKPVRDWVKKLLGRLVFIHFLQKKGWMGCDIGSKKWEKGDPKFLLNLFANCPNKDKFNSTRLVPLFFEALNVPDRPRDVFGITGTRVPYLNGGLFEELIPSARSIDFPANYFSELLAFFTSYNFTIDENDPEEHEVGIDPEMLGHIFENLLEENRDKGAYYTRKSVVQYMCQQALLMYLKNHLGEQDGLESLIMKKDVGPNEDGEWLRRNAVLIGELLDNVTVCDPAIGSGAFPIGMLQEIFWAKLALEPSNNDPAKFAEIKRRIILHSIHGVDLDSGAVEIARLRCWLAIVVDEIEPRTLPNLDFKIHCANSLIEYLRGEPVNISVDPTNDSLIGRTINDLIDAKTSLFTAEKDAERRKARLAVYTALAKLGQIEFTQVRNSLGLFVEGERPMALDRMIHEFGVILEKAQRARALPAREKNEVLKELEAWFNDPAKPTFMWRLHFGEVFSRGGFDILIANPPYINSAKTQNKDLLAERFTTYDSSGDLYICFYELARRLAAPGYTIAFITSNQFFRADYGLRLRTFLLQKSNVRTIIDVSTAPAFKVAAYPAIVVLSSHPSPDGRIAIFSWEEAGNPPFSMFSQLAGEAESVPPSCVKTSRWLPISVKRIELLNRLLSSNPALEADARLTMRRGVVTGYDKAFIIDRTTRDKIIARDPSSKQIIHPILTGRELDRWNPSSTDRYLIFARRGINIRNYPGVQESLLQYRSRLQPGEAGGRKKGSYEWYEIQDSTAYADLFGLPKIAWGNLAQLPLFCWVDSGVFLNAPSPFIVGGSLALLALLNSPVSHFIIHYTAAVRRGGYREYKPVYVGRLPIPRISESDERKLSHLSKISLEGKVVEPEQLLEAVVHPYRLNQEDVSVIRDFLHDWQALSAQADSE